MNFRRKAGSSESQGFQMTPMIDIMFLLLCFFVTSQIYAQWESEIDITLPTSTTGDMPDRLPAEIIVNVSAAGAMTVNKISLDEPALGTLLQRIAKHYPGQPVLIRADRSTAYEHVIGVLDLCRGADIWNISFATSSNEK
jgi:biopolymer transport protein ExbD